MMNKTTMNGPVQIFLVISVVVFKLKSLLFSFYLSFMFWVPFHPSLELVKYFLWLFSFFYCLLVAFYFLVVVLGLTACLFSIVVLQITVYILSVLLRVSIIPIYISHFELHSSFFSIIPCHTQHKITTSCLCSGFPLHKCTYNRIILFARYCALFQQSLSSTCVINPNLEYYSFQVCYMKKDTKSSLLTH